jgi:hypothetical protein
VAQEFQEKRDRERLEKEARMPAPPSRNETELSPTLVPAANTTEPVPVLTIPSDAEMQAMTVSQLRSLYKKTTGKMATTWDKKKMVATIKVAAGGGGGAQTESGGSMAPTAGGEREARSRSGSGAHQKKSSSSTRFPSRQQILQDVAQKQAGAVPKESVTGQQHETVQITPGEAQTRTRDSQARMQQAQDTLRQQREEREGQEQARQQREQQEQAEKKRQQREREAQERLQREQQEQEQREQQEREQREQQERDAEEANERRRSRTRSRAESTGSDLGNVSDWEAVQDPDYPNQVGPFYFWNFETDEVLWELPEGLEKPWKAGPLLFKGTTGAAAVATPANPLPTPQPSSKVAKKLPKKTAKPNWARQPQQKPLTSHDRRESGGFFDTPRWAKPLELPIAAESTIHSTPVAHQPILEQPEKIVEEPAPVVEQTSTSLIQWQLDPRYGSFTAVLAWMQDVLGPDDENADFSSFGDGSMLQSGMLICQLLNILEPGSVSKIHKVKRDSDGQFGAIAKFRISENVTNFIKGCQKLGMPRNCAFDTQELTEMRDLKAVLRCLETLAKMLGQM